MNNTMLNAALHYAEMGFAVFPLKPRDKTPLTLHGCKEATVDPQTIRRWWNRSPDANIGLATGAISGGVCVVDIDIDDEKGIDGSDVLAMWESENGKLPTTAIAITGRGGYHYYYKCSEQIKNRANILEGIDFRGDGGYVVAPPSIHKNGTQYEWEYDPDEFSIVEADSVVMKLLDVARKSTTPTQVEKFDVKREIGEGGRNDGLYRVACHYQALDYGNEEIKVLVKSANATYCKPPLDDAEVDKILGSALGLPKGKSEEYKKFHSNKEQSIEDVVKAMHSDSKLSSAIKYNTLAYSPWVAGELPWSPLTQREWTDVDDSQLLRYMEHEYNLYKKEKVERALEIIQHENRFSPIVEHLNTLKGIWDGKPRYETLLIDFLGAEDTELNREIMKLFMYGAIARAYHPGTQFDYMLILVGAQGVGKSTFLRELAMSNSWFDGNFNTIDGNQAVERLRGMWILEMSELLALKRTKDVESMKSFVTTRNDNYREPYGRRTTSRPRQCVFAGTTNIEQFLSDRSGNRRFLPVMVNGENIKLDLFDKEFTSEYFLQAWAEALHYYEKDKPKLTLSMQFVKQMIEHQQGFTEEDTRVGRIQQWLNDTHKLRVCVLDVWEDALNYDSSKLDLKLTKDIHTIMKTQIEGWKYVGKKRCSYGVQRCYERERVEGFEEDHSDVPF